MMWKYGKLFEFTTFPHLNNNNNNNNGTFVNIKNGQRYSGMDKPTAST
jgi:hypothetical protein